MCGRLLLLLLLLLLISVRAHLSTERCLVAPRGVGARRKPPQCRAQSATQLEFQMANATIYEKHCQLVRSATFHFVRKTFDIIAFSLCIARARVCVYSILNA